MRFMDVDCSGSLTYEEFVAGELGAGAEAWAPPRA